MKKLKNLFLGRKLSPTEQKMVLGGVGVHFNPCRCECDGPSDLIWIIYSPSYSSCPQVIHSENCPSDGSYHNASCRNGW